MVPRSWTFAVVPAELQHETRMSLRAVLNSGWVGWFVIVIVHQIHTATIGIYRTKMLFFTPRTMPKNRKNPIPLEEDL